MDKINQSESDQHNDRNEALSEKALDQAVGGLNPQPLPPHDPELTSFKIPVGCPGWF